MSKNTRSLTYNIVFKAQNISEASTTIDIKVSLSSYWFGIENVTSNITFQLFLITKYSLRYQKLIDILQDQEYLG